MSHATIDALTTTDCRTQTIRALGDDALSALHPPTSRDEAWRYTPLGDLLKREWTLAEAKDEAVDCGALALEGLEGPRLVFINGGFSPTHSTLDDLPEGVSLGSWCDTSPDPVDHPWWQSEHFAATNAANAAATACLTVGDAATVPSVIQIIHCLTCADGEVAYPRTRIAVGQGASVSIVERYLSTSDARCLIVPVTESTAAESAQVQHVVDVSVCDSARVMSSRYVEVHAGTDYHVTTANIGGEQVRHTVVARLLGEEGNCDLDGISLLHGSRHVDNNLLVEHVAPQCTSREYYKAILEDRSRSVFTGRIHVVEGAQKTDAVQTSQALIQSDEAQAVSKPQLEIYADDVKCTHGATVGQIDELALYYFQSRGIDAVTAREMLVYAFANEIISGVQCLSARRWIESALLARLTSGTLLQDRT